VEGSQEDFSRCVRSLVDEYRGRCLWFLRADFYPESDDQIRRTLSQIEKHGDLRAFQEVSRLKLWLSRHSSEASAA
jgi:hypothetical protein